MQIFKKSKLSKPIKYGWRWWQNRQPFNLTIADLMAQWTAQIHERSLKNAK